MSGAARPPYTSDESRIVISFNNASGGHVFAHWVRNELMLRLKYFSSRSIYLDNVETRGFGAVDKTVRHLGLGADGAFAGAAAAGREANAPIVGIDTRGVGKGGTTPIGAMFMDKAGTPQDQQTWFKSWQSALVQSKALLQIQTPEYFQGDPCAQERARIDQQLAKSNNGLTVVAITLSDKLPQMASGQKASTIPLRLGPTIQHPKLPDCWILRPSDLSRLTQVLISLGC